MYFTLVFTVFGSQCSVCLSGRCGKQNNGKICVGVDISFYDKELYCVYYCVLLCELDVCTRDMATHLCRALGKCGQSER